jgi:hypothetical protein
MGKQAKKKDASLKTNQHHHNRATRGVNTRRVDLYWNPTINPSKLSEDDPLKELDIIWENELPYYAAENRAKISVTKEPNAQGYYVYAVHDKYSTLLMLYSTRKVTFNPARKRQGKNRR